MLRNPNSTTHQGLMAKCKKVEPDACLPKYQTMEAALGHSLIFHLNVLAKKPDERQRAKDCRKKYLSRSELITLGSTCTGNLPKQYLFPRLIWWKTRHARIRARTRYFLPGGRFPVPCHPQNLPFHAYPVTQQYIVSKITAPRARSLRLFRRPFFSKTYPRRHPTLRF